MSDVCMFKIKLGFNRGSIAEFQIIKYLNFDFIYPTGDFSWLFPVYMFINTNKSQW
jgi:hypothetical protein